MRRSLSFIFFALILVIFSCSKKQDSYYPLKEGLEFKYKITQNNIRTDMNTEKTINTQSERKFTIAILATKDLKGKSVIPIKTVYDEKKPSYSYITKEKDGIATYASQRPDETEPNIKYELDYFIKYPIEAGTIWTKPGKVHSKEEFPIVMNVKIETIKDTVQVPAGNFNDCLKLKGEGVKEISIPLVGIIKYRIETLDWYAPGVGWVKGVLRQECSLPGIGNITYTAELIEYKK